MKKLIFKSILVLFAVIFLTGCSFEKGDLSTATLTGYDGRSFEETMEQYCEYMTDNGTAVRTSFSSDWQEGWVGEDTPSAEILASNGKAVTYILSITLVFEDEVEKNQMVFWMNHKTKSNTLSVQGGYMNEKGNIYPFDKSEARNLLEEIFDEYN